MDFSSVSFVPVLVAAIAAFFIGFLWHGPLFGKQWMKMMEIPKSKIDAMQAQGMGPMVPRMIAALVQQIVIAFMFSWLAGALGVASAGQAVMLAVWIWLGFVVTVLLNTVLWENRKMNLYLFNIVHLLVAFIAVSLIVVLWR